MEEKYFFGINGQKVGPLDEESIRLRIRKGEITAETLSWRKGMGNWMPLSQIPELSEAFKEVLAKQQVLPPDLPKNHNFSGQSTPPPFPPEKTASSVSNNEHAPEGLSPFEASCYRFAKICFRPCFGFQSPVGKMVEKNPRSAVPVMIGTACLMAVIVWMAVSNSKQSAQQASAPAAEQQAAQTGGDWRAQYQAMRSAQQFTDNVIDESYKYRRDSQDRMDETYRRANYDWYTDKD